MLGGNLCNQQVETHKKLPVVTQTHIKQNKTNSKIFCQLAYVKSDACNSLLDPFCLQLFITFPLQLSKWPTDQ